LIRSKKYVINHKTKSNDDLRDTISRWSKSLFNKNETNQKETFWALQNINLEVKQGDRLGLIGANGAGKSTLLKVLSRITEPTTGIVRVKGRMASLLEVGTGFHPELTGRENIYLNGAILGMSKAEITSQFDQIVDFAGNQIAQFLDTPVKRYSSGMYVRLAFAVAAHLEPEILIVDEVLAVGDAEFQKKCLGKMGDVSKGEGRTVLFVSHNMAAVKSLCNKGIYLKNGMINEKGEIENILTTYLLDVPKLEFKGIIPKDFDRLNLGKGFITKIEFINNEGNQISEIKFKENIEINVEIEILEELNAPFIDIKFVSKDGIIIAYSSTQIYADFSNKKIGLFSFKVTFNNYFQPDKYNINIGLHNSDGTTIEYLENIYDFEILKLGEKENYMKKWQHGFIELNGEWNIKS
jgi:lipopolysaccharide transport system ATP-binding protein